MSVRNPRRVCPLIVLGIMPLMFGGCPRPPVGGGSGDPALASFDSPGELLNYFKSQATASLQFGRGFGADILALEAPAGPTADAAGDAGGDAGFTTTNIQESGVDESDVVKSDGTHLYIVRDSSLRIVSADPHDQMAEVGRIDVDERIESIYLRGSKVILLTGELGVGGIELLVWPPFYQGGNTVIYEIDVADRSNPTVSKRIELDGSLATSRLTNDRLIAVLSIVPDLPEPATPLSIALMTMDQIMPKARTSSGTQDIVAWQEWLRPESPDGHFMTAVVTLDADDIESIVASVAVMSNSSTIYASREALYVADAEYDAENHYREFTSIHKFAFDQDGAAGYAASGSIPGRLLNQFSLGEHDGYLRAATHIRTFNLIALDDGPVNSAEPDAGVSVDATAQSFAPPEPSNAVFVLGEVDGNLEVVGEIRGIAPGERIFSARFMGERGFLVTFRQIDPLFGLDLSDPENPILAGELKIPGFSDYLHPLGESHLIGVGRATETTEFGAVIPAGLQLSLFDISDLSDPTLVHQITVGGPGSSSDVSRTHKAFTITRIGERDIIAIPAELWSQQGQFFAQSKTFDGVLTYAVDTQSGFEDLGSITGVVDSEYGWAPWRRAAFIGDVLYAITPQGVSAARLSSIEDVSSVILGE